MLEWFIILLVLWVQIQLLQNKGDPQVDIVHSSPCPPPGGLTRGGLWVSSTRGLQVGKEESQRYQPWYRHKTNNYHKTDTFNPLHPGLLASILSARDQLYTWRLCSAGQGQRLLLCINRCKLRREVYTVHFLTLDWSPIGQALSFTFIG